MAALKERELVVWSGMIVRLPFGPAASRHI
jgi:hypothetical protein